MEWILQNWHLIIVAALAILGAVSVLNTALSNMFAIFKWDAGEHFCASFGYDIQKAILILQGIVPTTALVKIATKITSIALFALLVSACTTPCAALAKIIAGEAKAEPVVNVLCHCIANTGPIYVACVATDETIIFTKEAEQAVYDQFCTPKDAWAKSDKPLVTTADFKAYFLANGAKSK